ncbi:unnamed protein product [Phytophthora fragariaefolia]|uniref:Unnamed protein product n=1 Tax=Phytophthora fragariaefolia TaxID=1490495 RepID=A0A9W6WLF7_9STRA|nr:unnamed protein product [Phytophthora fragariaefolia]
MARRGRIAGVENYSVGDLDALLKYIGEVLPTSASEWENVRRLYDGNAADNGRADCELVSLKNRAMKTANVEASCGDECYRDVGGSEGLSKLRDRSITVISAFASQPPIRGGQIQPRGIRRAAAARLWRPQHHGSHPQHGSYQGADGRAPPDARDSRATPLGPHATTVGAASTSDDAEEEEEEEKEVVVEEEVAEEDEEDEEAANEEEVEEEGKEEDADEDEDEEEVTQKK